MANAGDLLNDRWRSTLPNQPKRVRVVLLIQSRVGLDTAVASGCDA